MVCMVFSGKLCHPFVKIHKDGKIMLTAEDRRILRYLQAEPGLSPAELADRCRIAPATVSRRLARMEQKGVLRGVGAVIDWAALGYSVEVSLRFTLDKTQAGAFEEFLAAAREVPEVLEIQTFLGRVDVRLSVIARDMAHYQQVYRGRILTLPHIAEIEALMHVARIKSNRSLPI
jgi:Lrp/AsnC family transcriptional regulator